MIEAERIVDAAEEVLRGPGYRDLAPSPVRSFFAEVQARFAEWLFDVFGNTATSWVGQAAAIAVVVVVVVLLVLALASMRRSAKVDVVVDDVTGETVAQVLARADEARARGDLVAAVRARYGALLLLLAERDVLPARPGTTVGEVDAAVAAALPVARDAVRAGGRALADVVYGHADATVAQDDAVAAALDAVREAPRPQVVVVPA